MARVKLNIGSGSAEDLLPDWTNIDLVDGPGVNLVADCCNLPHPDESVDAIRTCHMVEHLSKPQLEAFAAECLRVLKPGGSLEVIAPAMDTILDVYAQCKDQESIAVCDFQISPLDWLDNLLFSKHLHETDYHRQGIYPEKLRRVFGKFSLHQFDHRDRRTSRWELRMTCVKPGALLCSVVMSTRNKAVELDRTLASIYAQDVPFGFEVIVVDDGSTDGTQEVCRRHGVRYLFLHNPRYRNPATARNAGYRIARGRVIIAQSDDVVHVSPNTIEYLATNIRPRKTLMAAVYNVDYSSGTAGKQVSTYCGPGSRRPYFFLGAVWRSDLYAVGGCDEEFVEPCYDDNWFADCLTHGLGIQFQYTDDVVGHHQRHAHPDGALANYHLSRKLYEEKIRKAKRGGKYISSGGAWAMEEDEVPSSRPAVVAAHAPQIDGAGKIPRAMHFFWAAERMSWMRFLTIYSFRCYHPDWKIVLHRAKPSGGKQWKSTETQDSQTYAGPNYATLIDKLNVEVANWSPPVGGLAPAHASDLCQWEILSTQGGWYADMDILWVAPLPAEQLAETDAVFCLSLGFMAIGLFASAPGNKLFADVLESALDGRKADAYQSTGAEAVYRVGGVWPDWPQVNRPGEVALAKIREDYPQANIAELPSQTVYPWPYTEVAKIFSETHDVPAGCSGIHWFGGNQLAQQWNNTITHENMCKYDSTFTRAAAPLTARS